MTTVASFDSLKVTTMTVVMPLEGSVNLDVIFPLLDIIRLPPPPPPQDGRRTSSKFKMPFLTNHPGSILSARYLGKTRGLLKSKSKGFFRNSITIDMSAQTKNVNLKLSKNKIQMCGASSVEMAHAAGQLVIDNLIRVDDTLTYLRSKPEETEKVVEWIKDTVRGPLCLIPQENAEPVLTTSIVLPETLPSNGLDEKILLFLLKQAPDFINYNEYCNHLDSVVAIESIIQKPLRIITVSKVMVNYNYDLGCKIDRWALAQSINNQRGFISRYDNTMDYSVTIKLPYVLPEGSNVHRRNNKTPHHIFIVYRSGLVTQTGPSEELMREPYERFVATIEALKPYIAKVEPATATSATKVTGRKKLNFLPSTSESMSQSFSRSMTVSESITESQE